MVGLNSTLNTTVSNLDSTLNASISLIQPIVEKMQYITRLLQLAVGGVIVLYVILLYLRWRNQKAMLMTLKRIENNIELVCQKLRVVPERRKRNFMRNIFSYVRSRLSNIKKRI